VQSGKVPSSFAYQFLAKVCSSIDFQQPGHSAAGLVNHELQFSVCQQILGNSALCSSATSSPYWSAMVYRTSVELRRSNASAPPVQRLVVATSPFGQARPSSRRGLHSLHIPLRPLNRSSSSSSSFSILSADEPHPAPFLVGGRRRMVSHRIEAQLYLLPLDGPVGDALRVAVAG
jgi:hypothetical protein